MPCLDGAQCAPARATPPEGMLTTNSRAQARLQTELQALLDWRVAVVCTGVDGDPNSLWPEEREAVAKAIPRRQREFASGRIAARHAMKKLGYCDGPVPANQDRSPRWPLGFVGALSHSSTICLAILGRTEHWRSMGIDIEPDAGIEESLWSTICSKQELDWVFCNEPRARAQLVTKIFTAKEAFYKSSNPEQQSKMDFQNTSTSWSTARQNISIFTISTLSDRNPVHGSCIHIERSMISWVLVGRE